MTQTLPGDEVADEICRDCGYEPELKRSLNGFQIFATAGDGDVVPFGRIYVISVGSSVGGVCYRE